jgi:hypothetical protein
MGVDQARHQDISIAIDPAFVWKFVYHILALPDRYDPFPIDHYRSMAEYLPLGVHGDDSCVLKDHGSAPKCLNSMVRSFNYPIHKVDCQQVPLFKLHPVPAIVR